MFLYTPQLSTNTMQYRELLPVARADMPVIALGQLDHPIELAILPSETHEDRLA